MNSTDEEPMDGFPILFSRDEFKKDILQAMLVLASQANFAFVVCSTGETATSEARMWALLSDRPYSGATFFDPGMTPDDMGLNFLDVERLAAAQTLLRLYDYGVLGHFDPTLGLIDSFDGYENQLSRILYDLGHSTFLQEWGDYAGSRCPIAVDHCLYVCELANARLLLEGSNEGYFLEERYEGQLSIRQMSLLSGMTEASIRTLASRKGKNALQTTRETTRTAVAIDDAKAWLVAKGRYVTIKKARTLGSADFTARKFVSVGDLEDAIADRLAHLNYRDGEDVVSARVIDSGVVPIFVEVIPGVPLGREQIGESQLADANLMRRLAHALEVSPDLFALRAAEAVLHDKLRAIENQVKQAQPSK